MVIESMEKLNMQAFVDKKIPAEHLSFYNQLEILEDRLINYDKPRIAKLERVRANGDVDLIDNEVEPIGELRDKDKPKLVSAGLEPLVMWHPSGQLIQAGQ